jgi:3-oxoadipate enol-lactonase/4-carboxymuconolactone decarboxylase
VPSPTTAPGFRVEGRPGGPAIVLGPSLGTSAAVWDEHVGALAATRRVIRYDLPGHGTLAAAAPAPVGAADPDGVARIAAGVLAVADALGEPVVDYAGISLGGAVGLFLARHHPDRVRSLTMVCSSAQFGAPSGWLERAAAVRAHGTGSLAAASGPRWFTPASAERAPARYAALLGDPDAADAAGYAACCEALAGYDLRAELGKVDVPTLVIAGRDDPVTPPAHARLLADGIPGATLVEIAGAAHLAPVEQPTSVAAAMGAFLQRVSPTAIAAPDAERHAAGMAVRRAVLGDAHVDRAVAATTPLTADFQDLITRYAWGEIWTRPGLDRRARSVVTLTALVAGGHHNELAMHVRAALRNGLSREEIAEVLLQSAIYCGVPAANTAFAIARDTLAAIDAAEEG